jgi:hypothetical protein
VHQRAETQFATQFAALQHLSHEKLVQEKNMHARIQENALELQSEMEKNVELRRQLVEKHDKIKQCKDELQDARSALHTLTSRPTTPKTPRTPKTPPTAKRKEKLGKQQSTAKEFVKSNTPGLFIRRKVSRNGFDETSYKSLANQQKWSSSYRARRKNSLISSPSGNLVDSVFGPRRKSESDSDSLNNEDLDLTPLEILAEGGVKNVFEVSVDVTDL